MGVSDRQIVGNGVGIGVNFKFFLFGLHSFSLQVPGLVVVSVWVGVSEVCFFQT